jgi:hypothetical protein
MLCANNIYVINPFHTYHQDFIFRKKTVPYQNRIPRRRIGQIQNIFGDSARFVLLEVVRIMIHPFRYFIRVICLREQGAALSCSGLIHDVVIDIEIDIPHEL